MSLGSASPDAKKDRAIGIEYSHLQKNAPAGVFVMPSLESLRVWHGVIFVRKGVYQGGVFKFRVDLPPEYPELDAWPRVHTEPSHDLCAAVHAKLFAEVHVDEAPAAAHCHPPLVRNVVSTEETGTYLNSCCIE